MVRLDQIEGNAGRGGQHKAGEAGSRSKVDAAVYAGWHQRHELQRIGNVAFSDDAFVRPRDQVDGAVPATKKGLEPGKARFT